MGGDPGIPEQPRDTRAGMFDSWGGAPAGPDAAMHQVACTGHWGAAVLAKLYFTVMQGTLLDECIPAMGLLLCRMMQGPQAECDFGP